MGIAVNLDEASQMSTPYVNTKRSAAVVPVEHHDIFDVSATIGP